jgi:hypothetical protein
MGTITLKDFIPIWKPKKLPVRLSGPIGAYVEHIGHSVRVDRDHLIALLVQNGYTVDNKLQVSRPEEVQS